MQNPEENIDPNQQDVFRVLDTENVEEGELEARYMADQLLRVSRNPTEEGLNELTIAGTDGVRLRGLALARGMLPDGTVVPVLTVFGNDVDEDGNFHEGYENQGRHFPLAILMTSELRALVRPLSDSAVAPSEGVSGNGDQA